jgi:hypothetical protein
VARALASLRRRGWVPCGMGAQPCLGNSSHPWPNDDRRGSPQAEKKSETSATTRRSRNQRVGPNGVRPRGERRSPLRDYSEGTNSEFLIHLQFRIPGAPDTWHPAPALSARPRLDIMLCVHGSSIRAYAEVFPCVAGGVSVASVQALLSDCGIFHHLS